MRVRARGNKRQLQARPCTWIDRRLNSLPNLPPKGIALTQVFDAFADVQSKAKVFEQAARPDVGRTCSAL